MRKQITTVAIALLIGLSGCYYDKADKLYPLNTTTNTCDTTTTSYANDILPILNANCNLSGCHDNRSAYNFTVFATLQTWALNGRLVGDINMASGFNPMPKNLPKLPDCSINKITRWVNQGAQNN